MYDLNPLVNHITRNLGQKKNKDLDRIFVHNEQELVEALSEKKILSIFIEADEISLSNLLEINKDNLAIGGYSSANTKPILRCANNKSGIVIR